MKRITLLLAAPAAVLFSIGMAAVPQLINFQGVLKGGSGNPVANGSYFVTFRIYDVPSGGTAMWADTQTVVASSGLFNAILGRGTAVPDSVFNDSVRYLGIQVFPDPEMTPRQRLSSVGFSYVSGQWNSVDSNLYRLNGNVGIGTSIPDAKLTVVTGGGGVGVFGGGYGIGGWGVFGNGSTGVVGSGGDYGVSGTGCTYGGYFLALCADTSYGVYGSANSIGGSGVYGSNGGQGLTWAGYFSGDVKVTGGLNVDGFIYKNGGGFKIDHPTDPANKYLYHSFVESPDMMNIYNGNITLNDKGEATIQLPDWFGALNQDFRYQLTCIGGFAPVYVADKIKNNRFRIAGGNPGMEVSWQITGIRKDAYAEAHRIPVEEEKTGKEKGKYLHPEEFGISKTLGMHYEEEQRMAAEQKRMEEERVRMEQERMRMNEKVKEIQPNK